MKPIIEVRNLSKQYKIGQKQPYLSLRDSVSDFFKFKNKNTEGGDFWALDDISFDVHAGESIGIIGRNGAGKSTLLKILSRITPPTKGTVILRGHIASLLEVGTGFHPELSGRENVFMNGSILGLKRAEIARKFDEIVAFSGVEQFIDTPLKHYSSGMQLRLAFSVAAYLEPEILVIDEVLAVGDAEFQKKCLGKMRQISQNKGLTIIFVSHNLLALEQLCQRALVLESGRINLNADAAQAISYYNKINHCQERKIDLSTVVRQNVSAQFIFTEIEFEKDIFKFGDSISFSLTIKRNPNNANLFGENDIELGVGIDNHLGNRIFHLSNTFLGQKLYFQKHSQKEVFRFNIESCGLRTGNYRVVLFLRVSGIIQDWLTDIVNLEIADGNPYGFSQSSIIQGGIFPKFSIETI